MYRKGRNPQGQEAPDFNNQLKIAKQSAPCTGEPHVDPETIKRLTWEGSFHLPEASRRISAPSLIFHSSTLPAACFTAPGYWLLQSVPRERGVIAPVDGRESHVTPCHLSAPADSEH